MHTVLYLRSFDNFDVQYTVHLILTLSKEFSGLHSELHYSSYYSLTCFDSKFGSSAKIDFPVAISSHTMYFLKAFTLYSHITYNTYNLNTLALGIKICELK